MNNYIELETRRIRLRQWTDDDAPAFAALNADPNVMKHFPAPLQRAESDALLERLRDLIADRGWGFWAAEYKPTASLIGFVGLNAASHTLPFSPCVEIGWRLAYAYWGRGLATEAARACLGIGFGRLALEEIVAFSATGNHRSLAVMERIGMRPAGTFGHPGLPQGHPLRHHYLYRLPRADHSP